MKNSVIKSIGADPEIFVYDTIIDKIVSVEGMIKTPEGEGSKEIPLKIKDGYYLQEDGISAEFNIKPTLSKQEFIDGNMFMLDTLKVFLPDDVTTKIQTSAYIDKEYLQTPQTMMSGCSPSQNIWSKSISENADLTKTNLRCNSGHIHLGLNDISLENTERIVRKLELFVGVPSIIFDPDTDRRTLFGKAGEVRFKPYGVEWRTPSNFWLKNENTMSWMFDNIIEAVNIDISDEELDSYSEDIQDIINNTNINKAYEFCNKFNINLKKVKV